LRRPHHLNQYFECDLIAPRRLLVRHTAISDRVKTASFADIDLRTTNKTGSGLPWPCVKAGISKYGLHVSILLTLKGNTLKTRATILPNPLLFYLDHSASPQNLTESADGSTLHIFDVEAFFKF
jgi:hypothetical protein